MARPLTDRGFRQRPPHAVRPGLGDDIFRGAGLDSLDIARDLRELQLEQSLEAAERASEQSLEQAERLREQQLEAAERNRELLLEQAERREDVLHHRNRRGRSDGVDLNGGRRSGPPPHALEQQRRAAEQALAARLNAAARLRDVAEQTGHPGPLVAADRIEQLAREDHARHLERIQRLSRPAVPATGDAAGPLPSESIP